MKLTSDDDYERALREFSKLEGRELDETERRRKTELEGAIAAYAAEPGRPATRKGRPGAGGETM